MSAEGKANQPYEYRHVIRHSCGAELERYPTETSYRDTHDRGSSVNSGYCLTCVFSAARYDADAEWEEFGWSTAKQRRVVPSRPWYAFWIKPCEWCDVQEDGE